MANSNIIIVFKNISTLNNNILAWLTIFFPQEARKLCMGQEVLYE